jgi:hypothetical protein
MTRRRTDLLSESIDRMPRWLRPFMRFQAGFFKVVRGLIALQAVGGLVGLLVGTVTLDGALAAGGLAQMTFAGLVFGLDLGSDEVIEARGPAGEFVIRAGSRRLWRDAQGLRRISKLVMGDRAWVATVRRRADDPFGAIVVRRVCETQGEANAEANALAGRIRRGENLTSAV